MLVDSVYELPEFLDVGLTFFLWRSWHLWTCLSMQALFCTGIAFLPRSMVVMQWLEGTVVYFLSKLVRQKNDFFEHFHQVRFSARQTVSLKV